MAKLESSLILSLIDHASAPARGVAAAMRGLQDRIAANNVHMAAMRGQMVDAAAVGFVLARAIGAPVTAAADFEATMNRVGAALSPTNAEMEQLNALAKEMGRTTQYSVNEAGLAIEMLGKNGLDTADIVGGALKTSMDVAASSGADLSTAADIVTDTMYNFKIEAGELATVADGIAGVLVQSKFGIDDYRLALGQAGGVAGGLGVTLEDFNTTIAATSSYFASGSDAGTSFKTFLQRLVPASAPAAEAMRDLNLEFFDANGNMKSMAEISQELRDGLDGLSDEAKNAALQDIFGTDAVRTAIALADVGSKAFLDLQAVIANTSAADQARARMEGFWGTVKRLQSAMDLLAVTVGEALLPALTAMADKLIPVVDQMIAFAQANPTLTAAIVGTTSALVALRIASLAARYAFAWMGGAYLSTMLAGLKGVGRGILLLASAMAQLRAAALGAAMLTSIGAGGLFSGLIASLGGVAAAVAGAVAGVTAPIWGLIAIVVAALAAVGIAVWKFWEPISAFFSGFGEVIGAALAEVGAAISGFAYDRVVDLAAVFGVTPEQVAAATAAIGEALAGIGSSIISFFAGLPAQIGNWLSGIFTQVQLTPDQEQGYRDMGARMARAIVSAFAGVGQAIADAFMGIDWVKIGADLMNAIWEGMKSIIPAMVAGLGNAIAGLNPFGGGGGAPAANENTPQRQVQAGDVTPGGQVIGGAMAAGGAIAGGKTYLVGEEGPELITPSRSGWVNTAAETQRMLGGGRSVAFSGPLIGSVQVNNTADVDALIAYMGEKLRDMIDGIQSDTGYRVA